VKTSKYVAPWLGAAAIAGAVGLAPAASASPASTPIPPTPATAPSPTFGGASPLLPTGTNFTSEVPYDPYIKNPAGGVDLPS
jgi:hypothetical protein